MEVRMNSKASKLANKVSTLLNEIADAANELKDAIDRQDEEGIERAVDMFPQPKSMADTFGKLGVLLQERPWEKRGKQA
jgi:hypothetical protein